MFVLPFMVNIDVYIHIYIYIALLTLVRFMPRSALHITMSEVAGDWHELMMQQPSIARTSEQLDPRCSEY